MIATAHGTTPSASSRRIRSTAAVLSGFMSVAVLSLVTDQMLHVLNVYPPWGEPMWDPKLNLLALSYRTLYSIVGGYLTAALAPRAAMRHVGILASIGTVAATAGAIAAITLADFGPDWYPILLAATSFPSVWLGGVIHRRLHTQVSI
jgi:hypothetical protein